MCYIQSDPHPGLSAHIDAYWQVCGRDGEYRTEKILPDGCMDIIVNLGEDTEPDEAGDVMQHGKAYIVGTMTRFSESRLTPDTRFLGIRFRPAAFPAFFRFGSLHELTDRTVELGARLAPDISRMIREGHTYLDQFLGERLSAPRQDLAAVIQDIQTQRGSVKVTELARRHFRSSRALERQFLQQVGISPKAFIDLQRYLAVDKAIRKRRPGQSLMDIAWEHGYYDHAHLTNDFKHYSGHPPAAY